MTDEIKENKIQKYSQRKYLSRWRSFYSVDNLDGKRKLKIFTELGFLTNDKNVDLNLTTDNERLVDY